MMIEVRSNRIDKIIQYFAPVTAQKRFKARAALAVAESYTGASRSKRSLSTFRPNNGDANSTIEYELDTLQSRSRDMIRNNPIAGSAIETSVTSVVGSGLSLDARIDYTYLGFTRDQADQWESTAEREFALWAESPECDVERSLSFYEMQELIYRSTLESGDVFVLTPRFKRADNPYLLKLQIIEADRCSNPQSARNTETLSFGIEREASGAPFKYHFSNFHPGSSIMPKEKMWTAVPAFGQKTHLPNVLHLYFKQRPGQSRGVPYLSPVIDTLRQLDKYTDAELTAAVVSAAFTVFIKSEGDIENLMSDLTPEDKKQYLSQLTGNSDVSLGNGSIVGLMPGEDVSIANPGRPNTAFDPFTQAIIAQIGARLNIPYELLLKRFTASYSASQAAFLEAWRDFKKRRAWLSARFCQPVYELFLYEAVSTGRIKAPGFLKNPAIRKAYSGAQWFGEPMGHIDPVKAANAATIRIGNFTSTIQRETAEIGGEWDKNMAQIAIEREYIKGFTPQQAVIQPENKEEDDERSSENNE